MEHPAKRFTQAEELLVHLADLIQDYSTFWSLCLASRTFYRIFRGHLWADIVWSDRNDNFFSDKDRLAMFLLTHKRDLSRAHSLRGVKSCIARTVAACDHENLTYLASMEVLQSHMPNLKSYEWAGPWNRDIVLRLARNCPRLERLCVRLHCDDRLSKPTPRQSWDACQKTLPCLTSAAYYPASTCESMERRAAVSGILSRTILRHAPALEDISFHWPKMKDIEEERRAVEDFVFYFIGFLSPEELSLNRCFLSQTKPGDSFPPMLRRMDICVSAYDEDGGQVCPRCAGRPTAKAMAVDGEDLSIVSLLQRVADAFEWTLQECLGRMICSAWSDGNSFWHVSLHTPEGCRERRRWFSTA